jgi:hypothetical protein
MVTINDSTNQSIYYGIYFSGTRFGIQARNTTVRTNTSTNTYSKDIWHHVACVFNSATDRKLYVNGVEEATGTDSVDFSNTANNKVLLGLLRLVSPTSYLNGKLSDVRIWNTARTQQQIADNYQKRLIGNESGLVGYWKLDKGSGTTVADSTTNANAGTITGAVWDNSEPFTEPIDDGTAVRLWSDQSGNGYDATQGGSAARPTYIASGLNGLPVVRFDGTDDRLSIPSSTATFKFLHSDVSTVFMVMKAGIVADPNAVYIILSNGTSSNNVNSYEIWWDDRASASRNNSIRHIVARSVPTVAAVVASTINNYFSANTYGILSVVSDPANATAAERSAIRLNGGFEQKINTQTATPDTGDAFGNLTIGCPPLGAGGFNGDIAEIIVYNRALNTSELAQVHRYLSRKWGIALA